jgi:hypothetical protein
MGDKDEVTDFIAEIVEEAELAPLIKDYRSVDIAPLENWRGFRIVT